jgi:hypothetical protein
VKIVNNEGQGTFTLVPNTILEQKTLLSMTGLLKPEDKFSYLGRNNDTKGFYAVSLGVGGHYEERTQTNGRSTAKWHEYVGGVKLKLRGSTRKDKFTINGIRNKCFFGRCSPIYLGKIEVEGKLSTIITLKRCKHCGANMVDDGCEWGVCEACVSKCEHEYVKGFVHGGAIDIGAGEYCKKCGRGKPKTPDEREKTLIEHHLAVEKDLGARVLYKDGPAHTPKELVKVARLSRRLAKSKAHLAQT